MTTAANIVNAWIHRTLPDIFYEEPDRVEDGMLQERPIDHLKRLLWERYRNRDDVFISGSVFVSYDRTNGNARVAPDLFIAFGVPAAVIRQNLPNFWLWEVGQRPDFVMEVASKSTAANDLGRKRNLYERLGIPEYWRFDPSPGAELYGQPLAGDRLSGGRYIPCPLRTAPDGSVRAHSELLGVDFHWSEVTGFDALDPVTGKTIDPMVALEERVGSKAARARAESARAETEAARARDAAARAEAESARARDAAARAETESARAESEAAHARDETARAEAEAARARAAEAERLSEREARLSAEARARQLEAELRRLSQGQ